MHPTYRTIAQILESIRDDLTFSVAESLTVDLPLLQQPHQSSDRWSLSHHQMAQTTQRFHDMIQTGLLLDWQFVMPEYEWIRRRIEQQGITWQHQRVLIDTYFAAALALHSWPTSHQVVLREVADRMRHIGELAHACVA